MSINENTIIFNKLYRSHYDDKEYFFEEILKKAILRTLTDDTVKAETMAANKVNRLWNSYKKQYEEDVSNGIVPLFSIVNNYEKKVRWIGECIFRKNCASVPEERSAVPLQTEQSSAGLLVTIIYSAIPARKFKTICLGGHSA